MRLRLPAAQAQRENLFRTMAGSGCHHRHARASKPNVSNKRLVQRILTVLGAAALFLLFLAAAQGRASATPIRPDVRKLVEQPPNATPPYEPARAGWNGPETSAADMALAAAQAARVQEVHRALAVVVTPDPRAWLAILLLIVVMRKLRAQREARQVAVPVASEADWQMPRAA
jgi:hypothetical protein